MRFLHGRNVHGGYCAVAETGYLHSNEGRQTRICSSNETKRKDTKMAQSIVTRHSAAASVGEELRRAIHAAMQRVVDYRAYRRTIRELSELSAHDLADLGLHHSEIRRVAYESVYGARA
jgi:uncharacterized protein YjiS (DUF1127 family)